MKISNIAAVLLIGTTVMMAETTLETDGIVAEGTEGASNTYYGLGAGDTGGGNYNSFFGWRAGFSTTGSYNTFSGYLSGNHNITGFQNTFSGMYSGFYNETGHSNTFSGYGSGFANKTGFANTFSGLESGYSNMTGHHNTFSGYHSGHSNENGSGNTFFGQSSGYENKTGSYNVFLGYQAGYHETVSDRLYIDNSSSYNPLIYGEFDNALVRINGTFETIDTITSTWTGSNTEGDGLTNLLLLSADNSDGDTSDAGFALKNARTDKQWNFRTADGGDTFSATIQGTSGTEFKVTNTTDHFSGVQLHLGNGAKNVGGLWIDASSRALKENIKELNTQDALAAFHKLQPVTYNYKSDKKEQVVGFIAEDVPELVAIQSRDGLSAMDMVAVLTKVMQAKDQKIAMMDARQKVQEEKIAKLESILTNLALDTSNTKKEKVSVNLK